MERRSGERKTLRERESLNFSIFYISKIGSHFSVIYLILLDIVEELIYIFEKMENRKEKSRSFVWELIN